MPQPLMDFYCRANDGISLRVPLILGLQCFAPISSNLSAKIREICGYPTRAAA